MCVCVLCVYVVCGVCVVCVCVKRVAHRQIHLNINCLGAPCTSCLAMAPVLGKTQGSAGLKAGRSFWPLRLLRTAQSAPNMSEHVQGEAGSERSLGD